MFFMISRRRSSMPAGSLSCSYVRARISEMIVSLTCGVLVSRSATTFLSLASSTISVLINRGWVLFIDVRLSRNSFASKVGPISVTSFSAQEPAPVSVLLPRNIRYVTKELPTTATIKKAIPAIKNFASTSTFFAIGRDLPPIGLVVPQIYVHYYNIHTPVHRPVFCRVIRANRAVFRVTHCRKFLRIESLFVYQITHHIGRSMNTQLPVRGKPGGADWPVIGMAFHSQRIGQITQEIGNSAQDIQCFRLECGFP